MTEPTVCDNLTSARGIMAEKDLCKKAFFTDANGREMQVDAEDLNDSLKNFHPAKCCILGAVYLATGSFAHRPNAQSDAVREALQTTLQKEFTKNPGDEKRSVALVFWNDELTRTKQDVLDLFDKTIAAQNCPKKEEPKIDESTATHE